jgi:small-conductance mechanosensitive channel
MKKVVTMPRKSKKQTEAQQRKKRLREKKERKQKAQEKKLKQAKKIQAVQAVVDGLQEMQNSAANMITLLNQVNNLQQNLENTVQSIPSQLASDNSPHADNSLSASASSAESRMTTTVNTHHHVLSQTSFPRESVEEKIQESVSDKSGNSNNDIQEAHTDVLKSASRTQREHNVENNTSKKPIINTSNILEKNGINQTLYEMIDQKNINYSWKFKALSYVFYIYNEANVLFCSDVVDNQIYKNITKSCEPCCDSISKNIYSIFSWGEKIEGKENLSGESLDYPLNVRPHAQ